MNTKTNQENFVVSVNYGVAGSLSMRQCWKK